MYIKKISLHNIGPYYGDCEFDFQTEKYKNIILIGGNNGSGKTTLLETLKISLFGSYALGFTTNSPTYIKRIESYLNKKALEETGKKFETLITFQLIEDYEKNEYIINRKWVKLKEEINEYVHVYKNSEKLELRDKENFLEKLKQIITPNLLDSFMIDGESIANLIESDNLSQYLKDVFFNSFNFNLIDQFQNDLQKYLKNTKEKNDLTEAEADILKLKNDLHAQKQHLNFLNRVLSDYTQKIKTEKANLQEKLKKFSNLGGLSKKQLRDAKSEFRQIEENRYTEFKELKSFFESLYPIYINKDLIEKSVKILKREFPYALANKLTSINDFTTIKDDAKKGIQQFLDNYFVDENTKLLFKEEDEHRILSVEKLLKKELSNYSLKDFKDKLNYANKNYNVEKRLRNKINLSTSSDELNQLTEEITSLQNKISDFETLYYETLDEQNNQTMSYENLKNLYNEKEKEIFKQNKSTNSFSMAQKIMKLNEEYVDSQAKRQIEEVNTLTTITFNNAINKRKFINKISINHKTFDIELEDYEGVKHSKQYLSAGERQILITSIISSILSLSRRRLAFIFDTPLARLDKQNRASFINEIVKRSSNQVVILSTDQEVVGNVLGSITKNIKRTYLLDSIDTNQTVIKENYFEEVF